MREEKKVVSLSNKVTLSLSHVPFTLFRLEIE